MWGDQVRQRLKKKKSPLDLATRKSLEKKLKKKKKKKESLWRQHL